MGNIEIDTSLAVVGPDEQGIVQVRVKEGAKLNSQGLREILQARKQLSGGKPTRYIAILPDGVDFSPDIIHVDHYREVNAASFTQAFAFVTPCTFLPKLYELYAALFKPNFPIKVFREVDPAYAWLKEFEHAPAQA